MSKSEELNSEYVKFVVDDTIYETTVNKKYSNRKSWERPNPKLIVSFLPGTLLDIFVKAGDKVKTGAPLLLFEAMKMHTAVNAPFDGTIKAVNVTTGEKVAKGHLLLEFE